MTPCIRIRRYRPRDLPKILAIENDTFPRDAYLAEMFDELYHSCGGLFLVARIDEKIVAYMATCRVGKLAEVVSIAVSAPFRRLGVAAALMRRTLSALSRTGAEEVWLMVRENNLGARRFYERFGFSRVRRVRAYYEDGAAAIRMKKPLPGDAPR